MRIQRPGSGLPLEDMPTWEDGAEDNRRFPHAIADFFSTQGVTLREQRMLEFISQVTDKPSWWEKINNPEIVARWREEACGTEEQQRTSSDHLDHNSFDYCLAELKDKAAYFEKHNVVHVVDVKATVAKSDLPLTDNFWTSLKSAAFVLEDVEDHQKDWHPWTDEQVLDLLHPSLFPLEYGKTRVLPDVTVPLDGCVRYTGTGEICQIPSVVKDKVPFSKNVSWGNESAELPAWGTYQWLPSEVILSEDGQAEITSYINNLHPERHKDLYHVLETAVDKAIPLWNECLSWFHDRVRIRPERVGYEDLEAPGYPGPTDEEREDEDFYEEDHKGEWIRDNIDSCALRQPSASEFVPFEQKAQQAGAKRIDIRNKFPEGLQVIFKLANIELTPDNPQYGGSNWHVEGCLNEHIAATALFYYDAENVTDSHLYCQQHVDAEEMVCKPEQGEWEPACKMYGVEMEGSAVQEIGRVLTRPGRILAFPNVLQHKVGSFKLQDETKPGHRKILAMFLIDPHIKILSTANVPPQRRDWWAEEVRKVEPFASLPVELFDGIIDAVEDFPISWEQACETRELLMEERGKLTTEYESMLQQDTFYFCEH